MVSGGLYPFAPHYLSRAGSRLHYLDEGAGPPVVCVHGNPNVLTPDLPSSALSQGTTAQHTLVEVERWTDELPELTVDRPPEFVPRPDPST